ncbi:MAG: GNAT family N-acetyltransferase [Myxococcales bacterium]|nr:GNAT family N-acetyltransferase [Myxococcales bacterium]MCB9582596.1 GNAT family N-acetyltransferase [Polyangiaceae bacterium]
MIRDATAADEPFLFTMLALAASMDESPESLDRARTDPLLLDYAAGFGAPGDLGVIADPGMGAAWLRLRQGEPHPMKLWTDDVPELAIAVRPAFRGQGVGAELLGGLVERARGTHPAIVLSVRRENPALHLYQRFGFFIERELDNRVGGVSYAMRLDLCD